MRKKSLILIGITTLALILGLRFWHVFREKDLSVPDSPPFAFVEPQPLTFPNNTCDISDYGAIPDGTTKNTESFQKAIADCSSKGGGKVFVPAGAWLTGAIHLKSNINLNLAENATVLFSNDPNDYLPTVFTRVEGTELYNYSSFIYAIDAENIAITGKGMLNGQGQSWQGWKTGEKDALQNLSQMAKNGTPAKERIFGFSDHGIRPSFVELVNCKDVWLEDFIITFSPRWTIHPIYCHNVWMKNLHVDTIGFNSDGIVIDSSSNILIEDSSMKSGDDTISIKSGLEDDGWRVNKPSENIVIRNSKIIGGHSGIAIGSEMSGGVKNIFLYNLEMADIDQGIRAKSTDSRGGFIANIWAKNIAIDTATNSAFQIDSTYPGSSIKSENEAIPTMQGFHVENMTVDETAYAIKIDGLKDGLISDVSLTNIKAGAKKGSYLHNCNDIHLENFSVTTTAKKPFDVKNCQYSQD